MPIDKFAFEVGFKRLEAAYGSLVNTRRMAVYLEEMGKFLTPESWQAMVQRAIRTRPQFPKLCELLEMLGQRKEIGTLHSDEEHLINSNCRVEECIDGVIWVKNGPGRGVARCRICNRGPTGYPLYKGPVTLRDEQEMKEIRNERIEIWRQR